MVEISSSWSSDEELISKYKLDVRILEELGLLHNNRIEREMVMQRFIDPEFLDQVPERRRKLITKGKNAGKVVHRYPYWCFSSGRKPKRMPKTFGSAAFRGNFIPQIPIMAIKRFTHIGDLVVDLTAGSGTTLDAAEFLHRRCLGYDLYPYRKDILPADADIPEPAKLIIVHPPYADLAINYGERPGGYLPGEKGSFPKGRGLSIPPDEFLVEFKKLIRTCIVPNLLPDGHVVLIIDDGWRGNAIYPLTARTVELFLDEFEIVHYIAKYVGDWTQRRRGIWEYRALARGFGVLEHEYVVIFKRRSVS